MKKIVASVILTSLLATVMPVQASHPDGWSYQLTAYVWAAGIEADLVGPGGRKINAEVSFSDLLDNLDFSGMLHLKAQHDRWGYIADVIALRLGIDGEASGPLFSGTEFDGDAAIATVAGTHRLVEQEDLTVDILAGVRAFYIDLDVDISAGLLPGLSLGTSETFVDPIVGASGRIDLSENLFLSLYGDIGGFGVDSDITWQASAGLGYEINDKFASQLGYRHLAWEFDVPSRQTLQEIELSGPFIGLSYKF